MEITMQITINFCVDQAVPHMWKIRSNRCYIRKLNFHSIHLFWKFILVLKVGYRFQYDWQVNLDHRLSIEIKCLKSGHFKVKIFCCNVLPNTVSNLIQSPIYLRRWLCTQHFNIYYSQCVWKQRRKIA